jgi:drug/metabolite transporter (DMT)-like permease
MNGALPPDPNTKGRIALPFAIVTLIWGSTWLAIHSQLGPVPTAWSVTYRFAVGAMSMFVVAIAMRLPLRLSWTGHGYAVWLGLATFAINYNMVYLAELHITSGLVAVLFSLIVPLNAVLGRIFLKQSLSRPFLIGSAIAMLGVALLFAHELRIAEQASGHVVAGIALTLGAVVFASSGNVAQGSQGARAFAMPTLLAWGMAWGAGLDALLAWLTSGPPVFDPSFRYAGGLLYLGIVASAVAFTLYFNLIRQIGAARGGYVNVLVPVIAMGFSTLFEGYSWTAEAAAGGALVLVGLALAMRARADDAAARGD